MQVEVEVALMGDLKLYTMKNNLSKSINRNYKGITLVEMIVVIAIIGIMLVPLYGVLETNKSIVDRTEDSANAKVIANTVYAFIEQKLKYAQTISTSDTIETTQYAIKIDQNQILYYSPETHVEQLVFDQTYFEEFGIEVSFNKVPTIDNQMEISVVITLPSGDTYTLGPNKLELINGDSAHINITTGDKVINYTLPDKSAT